MRKRTNMLSSLSSMLALTRVLVRTTPWHLGDRIIQEESPLRLALLKAYARIEVQFIRFLYWLENRNFVQNRWVKFAFYWCGGKLLGERLIVGTVKTLDEMEEFIEGLPEDSLIAVGPCRCRLATRACDHPLETDIYILTGAPIWLDVFPKDYRVIDKEETLRIVRDSYEQGLVPMVDRHLYFKGNANYFVICNCCGCSCILILGYRFLKEQGLHFIPSTYVSVVDADRCEACGKCVEVCAFHERRIESGKARVIDCQGCGLCVKFCPNGANSLVSRQVPVNQ
jgi:NAD-dependent dihydropyrimidine dehydrogenase PreA subunit